MPVRMFNPISPRIIQVLKDFLPAELDLIDAEESQAATDDIPNANYHEHPRPVVTSFPSVRLNPKAMSTTGTTGTRPDKFGQRLDAFYRYDVLVDVQVVKGTDDTLELLRLIKTYTAGIFRVLVLLKEQLQTTADPTMFAHITELDGDLSLGPTEDQTGHLVRTGSVPIKVRHIQQRV